MNGTEHTVEATITQLVKRWLEREAPRVRDDDVVATIKFSILQPRRDDDNTLCLELRVEERAQTHFDECAGLRVEGVAFDTEAAS